MVNRLLTSVFCCVLIATSTAYEADTSKCRGKPNDLPIITEEPKVTQTVENGYRMEVDGVDFPIIHVYGNAYDMGKAHGELMKDQIPSFFVEVEAYFVGDIVDEFMGYFPKWVQKSWVTGFVSKIGLFDFILSVQWWLEKSNIPQYALDEFKGLADGSGVAIEKFQHFSVLPEVNHMNCSMMGAWGPATESIGGTMLQLRALDWNVAPAFQKNAIVLIFHPESENGELGHPFALWTWAGFVGAITGYSSADVGMSEYGRDKDTKNTKNWGYPTPLLMRDVLQFDKNRFEGYERIQKADRTASVFLGLGDPQGFNIVSYNTLEPEWYGDKNFTAFNNVQVDNTVYIEDHHDGCFAELIKQYYGEITAETIVKYWPSMETTGNLHAAVYDMARRYIWVSVAKYDDKGDFVAAYDSQFTRLDLNKAFDYPAPKTVAASLEVVERED